MIRLWHLSLLAAASVALAGCTAGSGVPETESSSPPAVDSVVPWAAIAVPDDGPVLPAALLSDDLAVEVISDGVSQPGPRFHFVVRLTNTDSQPIPLRPCPSYRVQLQKVVEAGTLNCAGGPASIPANGHVDYAMEVGINPHVLMTAAPLLWQLGGEPTDQVAPSATASIAWT
jgi:hypothetical protein